MCLGATLLGTLRCNTSRDIANARATLQGQKCHECKCSVVADRGYQVAVAINALIWNGTCRLQTKHVNAATDWHPLLAALHVRGCVQGGG